MSTDLNRQNSCLGFVQCGRYINNIYLYVQNKGRICQPISSIFGINGLVVDVVQNGELGTKFETPFLADF